VAVVCGAGLVKNGCVAPKSFRQTKAPRSGRALGGRVAVVYSKHYQINLAGLERLHPFDIHKYGRIYLALNTDGYLRADDVFVPQSVTDEQILLVHSQEFLDSLDDSAAVARYLESPPIKLAPAVLIDAGILNAFRYATGGTIEAARQAMDYGVAVNLAGGYHHAMPDEGEGFNVYADMAIAIRVLQGENRIRRALVVDLDVHQGNGTATIFDGDDNVFTFSMHEGDIYPIPKATSDLDVELAAETDDQTYLRLLSKHFGRAIRRARPDIVFLQAGCDVLADDPLASVAMTPEGVVARDAMVIDECVRRGVPVVMVLGGGYSPQAWRAQHASIVRTLKTHAFPDGPPHSPRPASGKESLYSK
jgi:histone deacetylase 11